VADVFYRFDILTIAITMILGKTEPVRIVSALCHLPRF